MELPKKYELALEKKKGGLNSPFNDAVDQVMTFMRAKETFGYWCGRLRGIPAQEIHSMMSRAKEGTNRAALFNYLLKEYRKKK